MTMRDDPESLQVDNLPAARRSMRIAVVTETYPPEVNGVAITLAEVIRRLHLRNHDIQLIRPRQGGEGVGLSPARQPTGFHEVLMRGMPIPRYTQLRMGVPSKRALVRLWSVQRPDVVHIATEGPLGWSALQAAISLQLPVSSDFRTNFHAYSRHYGIRWLRKPIVGYLRKFHNLSQRTTVPTEALARELSAAGFERLVVVARGIDAQRFSPEHRSLALRQQWGLSPDDLGVLYVGRLAPEKNLDQLVLSFEAIERANPRARLVLVGDGPMRASLQLRMPRAVFCGQRTGMELAQHYASADLFLFPSKTETFGNVTVEAMASGLAVVAYGDGAALQLIEHGRNGLCVPVTDDAGFLVQALQLALDLSACRRLGSAARATALQLDWETIVDRLEGVLREVADPTRTEPVGRKWFGQGRSAPVG